jgi:hypothetical protein
MIRLRPFLPAVVLLLLGAACLVAVRVGAWPGDVAGVVQPPAYLVGVGTGCLILGTLLLMVASIRAFVPRISPLESGRS